MSTASLLPEDYLAEKAERRTNLICLSLFAVVMAAVFGAFLFTNKQWTRVKSDQEFINARYQQAGMQIQKLSELEQQKKEMLQKAELAAALVERVPRSILLAEFINRMPDQLGLLEFTLTSEKIKATAPTRVQTTARLGGGAKRAQTKQEAEEAIKKVEPPRYRASIVMVGVAPTDRQVAQYMSELNKYDLLFDVTLEYSEETEIEGRMMREFKIKMSLDPDADVRHIEPLIVPRDLKNPMSDDVQLTPPRPQPGGTVSANDVRRSPTGD